VSAFQHETDERLVEMARLEGSHDTRPFETLVRRHQGFVAANCRAITRSEADSEDLAQEVFVKAFFGLQRFEGRAKFRTWLQRIKVNHCLNHLRKNHGVIMMHIEELEPEKHVPLSIPASAPVELQSALDRERIVAVLDAMSDALRIPLMLRDADGQSYEEIATELGLSLSAVKMRIKRARQEFRRRFDALSSPAVPSPHTAVTSP